MNEVLEYDFEKIKSLILASQISKYLTTITNNRNTCINGLWQREMAPIVEFDTLLAENHLQEVSIGKKWMMMRKELLLASFLDQAGDVASSPSKNCSLNFLFGLSVKSWL